MQEDKRGQLWDSFLPYCAWAGKGGFFHPLLCRPSCLQTVLVHSAAPAEKLVINIRTKVQTSKSNWRLKVQNKKFRETIYSFCQILGHLKNSFFAEAEKYCCLVSYLCTRMNTEVFKRRNLWRCPSTGLGPVHREHMIGEHFAECQLVDGRLGLHVRQVRLSHFQPRDVHLWHARRRRLTSEQKRILETEIKIKIKWQKVWSLIWQRNFMV